MASHRGLVWTKRDAVDNVYVIKQNAQRKRVRETAGRDGLALVGPPIACSVKREMR